MVRLRRTMVMATALVGLASLLLGCTPATPLGSPALRQTPCGIAAEGAGQGLPASNRFGRGALDPEVFRSPDGRLYMVVALSRTAGNIGVVGLRSDGTMMGTSNAAPAVLASQSLPYHDGSDDGTRGNSFLENPSMIYEPQTRTYLLFYSAGHWFTDRYLTGFARCASPTGPCTLDNRGPFLKSGNGRTGPGGLTVFKDANGALKVAYASWQAGFENQVGSVGQYKRQTHWAQLVLTATSDPAAQSVSLR